MAVPACYEKLKKIRTSTTAKLKPCKYLRPETQLRYYQVVGTLNMLMMSRFLLGDAAGLGKTIQVIATYAILLEKFPGYKLLVVTQKSAMTQWGEEFDKFTTGISHHVLKKTFKPKGATRQLTGFASRKAQYEATVNTDVLITGYYSVKEDYKFLQEFRGEKVMVVFDECHEFKNKKTKAYNGASELALTSNRVYGLSATPIKNRLMEFYYILKILAPGAFEAKVSHFQKKYLITKMIPIQGGKRYIPQTIGYKNLGEFKKNMDPYFLNRKTRDVAPELPVLISKKVVVEMTKHQKKLYADALNGVIYEKRVKQRYFEQIDHMESLDRDPTSKELDYMNKCEEQYEECMLGDAMKNNKAVALSFCQMISNGPKWLGEEEEGESAKEEEFRRLMSEELLEENIIVFTRFESGIVRLQAILDDLKIKHTRVTGKEGGDERTAARLAFQDTENPVRVIFITAAGSAAINLQSASVEIFYDTPWSFGDLYQTIGRAQRVGSVHSSILLIHLVSEGSIDEHVLELLDTKKELIDQILGDIAEGSLEFGNDKLMLDEEVEFEDSLFDSIFK